MNIYNIIIHSVYRFLFSHFEQAINRRKPAFRARVPMEAARGKILRKDILFEFLHEVFWAVLWPGDRRIQLCVCWPGFLQWRTRNETWGLAGHEFKPAPARHLWRNAKDRGTSYCIPTGSSGRYIPVGSGNLLIRKPCTWTNVWLQSDCLGDKTLSGITSEEVLHGCSQRRGFARSVISLREKTKMAEAIPFMNTFTDKEAFWSRKAGSIYRWRRMPTPSTPHETFYAKRWGFPVKPWCLRKTSLFKLCAPGEEPDH